MLKDPSEFRLEKQQGIFSVWNLLIPTPSCRRVVNKCLELGDIGLIVLIGNRRPRELVNSLTSHLETLCSVDISPSALEYHERQKAEIDCVAHRLFVLLCAAIDDSRKINASRQGERTKAKVALSLCGQLQQQPWERHHQLEAALILQIMEYWGRWSTDKESLQYQSKWMALVNNVTYSSPTNKLVCKGIEEASDNWSKKRHEEALLTAANAAFDEQGSWYHAMETISISWLRKKSLKELADNIGKAAEKPNHLT